MKNEKNKMEAIGVLRREAAKNLLDTRKLVFSEQSYIQNLNLVRHYEGRLAGIEAVCCVLGIRLLRRDVAKVFNYEPRKGE